MNQRILILLGGALGIGVLMTALWAVRHDESVAMRLGAQNIAVAAQAVRCAAMAVAAMGEGLLIWLVIGNVWRRDIFTHVLGLSAVVIFLLSAAGAVALALAGR